MLLHWFFLVFRTSRPLRISVWLTLVVLGALIAMGITGSDASIEVLTVWGVLVLATIISWIVFLISRLRLAIPAARVGPSRSQQLTTLDIGTVPQDKPDSEIARKRPSLVMAKHIKIATYGSLIVGVISIINSIRLFVAGRILSGGEEMGEVGVDPRVRALRLASVVVLVGLMSLILSILLTRRRPWARSLALAAAIASLISPVSWYAIWVLTNPETKTIFGVEEASDRFFKDRERF
jgi:hypothetical protein